MERNHSSPDAAYRWLMYGLSVDQPEAHKQINELEIIWERKAFPCTFLLSYDIIIMKKISIFFKQADRKTVTISKTEYEKLWAHTHLYDIWIKSLQGPFSHSLHDSLGRFVTDWRYCCTAVRKCYVGMQNFCSKNKEKEKYHVKSEEYARRGIQYSCHPVRSASGHECQDRGKRKRIPQQ